MKLKIALYWNKINNEIVQCQLCPHKCKISNNNVGICRGRKNIDGGLYSINYGKVTGVSLDSIEKKPLNHFYKESKILSLGTFGCNLTCSFCQNHHIAHGNPETIEATPMQIIKEALELRDRGNIGIAYTYNEPTIWYEFVLETSKLAKKDGLKNVLVTNGFISKEPLLELLRYIDAMNIDLKTYSSENYREYCLGELDVIKANIELAHSKGCHIEITTLVVPGMSDNVSGIVEIAKWISSIDKTIPYHITRFFPQYKMQNELPTDIEVLKQAKNESSKFLDNVRIGNV